jgi:hypothetical protein
MLVFTFGQHENLNVLLNYKDSLNTLANANLIYVFTPQSLSTHIDVINNFPSIAFISATYMEIYHQEQRFSLMPPLRRGEKVFPMGFMEHLTN